ncbi:MAG: methyltransferase domain-containing protein [Acidobacteriota bacterium]
MPPTYDKIAGFYDRAFSPFEKRFLRSWRAETLGYLPVGASILEIGAGTGANFAFYPHCREAVASELSAGMLVYAREKAELVRLVQADAQLLPFPDSHFDAAFATLVFCAIPDPSVAFAEVMRVVKPGGKVVLLEHVRPPGILGPIFDLANVLTAALIDDHFNRRTADAAASAGLRVLEVKSKALGIVNLIICENPPKL